MKRRILITGATGFVGKQVLASLLERGVQVVPVVRPGSVGKLPASPQLEAPVLTEDLFAENESWWQQKLPGIDTLIHVAWYAEHGHYQFSTENMNCLIGTLRMAQAAAQAGVKRFVGVGTCFEYAQSGRPLPVDSPLVASSPYAACKAAAYFALSQLLPQYDVQFAWCRLFYLYGEGEDAGRLVPAIRKNLSEGRHVDLTAGTQVRDFLEVSEAGRQTADVALSDKTGAFNICSGKPVTVRELAESIADEYGRRGLLKFGARKENPVDPPYVVGVPELRLLLTNG
jgi:dTDP-6-deoxy-L-talose 4-dehydrogenase (NAD+)